MRVLYVQNPENMIGFFNDQIKNKTCGNNVIQRGRGGLRNAIGLSNEHVVSTGKLVKFMMSPQKNSNVTLIDPNVKSVNQAKEEMNRDAQTVIPVQTGMKRKAESYPSQTPKKRKAGPKKPRKQTKPKIVTALSS